MATWAEFAAASPTLAAEGQRLCMIEDPAAPVPAGLAYLGTVKPDGSPRVHPISPALHDGRLFAFILRASPKLGDLRADRRYALHSWPAPFPEEGFDDREWYVEGVALEVLDENVIASVARLTGERPENGVVFELTLERVLYKHRDDGQVTYERWPGSRRGTA